MGASNIFTGVVAFYVGTAGSEPTTPLGYTMDKSAKWKGDEEFLDANTNERLGFVKRVAINPTSTFACEAMEGTLANLAVALPAATLSGNTLSRATQSTTVVPCSVKIVGVTPAGVVRTFKSLYAYAKMPSDIAMTPREWFKVPMEFESYSGGDTLWSIVEGASENDVTISSGVATIPTTLTYVRLAGEGGLADTLTDIAAASGSFTDEQILIVQIQDEDQPITFDHAADAIEMVGSVDFVATSVNDVVWLQRETTGTKWVEIARRDFSALV